MANHKQPPENITEPQTIDEVVRATYRDVKDIKDVLFGKRSLCDRVTILETITKVLAWVMGISVTAGGTVAAWILLFKGQ
jgi:hypothetical protein